MRDTVSEYADTAREAVRALNHATYPGQSELRGPDDAYTVLCSLASLVYGLRQSLDQLAGWAQRQAQLRQIEVVDGTHAGDPAGLATAVRAELNAAVPALAVASSLISQAHQLMADVAAAAGDPR
jgi:hypothetical protein